MLLPNPNYENQKKTAFPSSERNGNIFTPRHILDIFNPTERDPDKNIQRNK